MSAYEIPLSANPQKFTVTLSGVDYRLMLRWNVTVSAWIVDIYDTSDNAIVTGIPLVTGVDLLEQYAYLNFGGMLIAQTDDDIYSPPTFDNLGTAGRLYWVTK